jgi:sugar O-acyltransferase (sialic acid O-acetyltransferase NeuD family)
MSLEVYILGAGGHANQVIDVFEELNYTIKGFFDDEYPNKRIFNKYAIINTINNIEKHLEKNSNLFCAIGNNAIRDEICTKLKHFNFINCVSPHSRISKNITIGTGNYIGHNVIISGGTCIGSHNILNESCILPHDCKIGNFNHISIGAVFGGNVSTGDRNLFGLNSTILPKLSIGNDNLIGAGSVIIRSLSDHLKYCGNPGKQMK